MTPIRRFLPLLLLGLALASPAATAKGDIYKWVDKDGVTHYGNQPPTDNAKPAELPPLQTYKGGKKVPLGTLESSSTAQPNPDGVKTISEIRITSPAADEVVRGSTVAVSAAVLPAAPSGASYVFFLDGKRLNPTPLASPSFSLVGLERGAHNVAVAAVDASGRELKRSAAVGFNAKPSVDGVTPPRLPGNTLPKPLPSIGKPR